LADCTVLNIRFDQAPRFVRSWSRNPSEILTEHEPEIELESARIWKIKIFQEIHEHQS